MPNAISSQLVDHLILGEFSRKNDANPLRQNFQELLIQAHCDNNYRRMALEYADDHFSRRGDAVQEAVRMYLGAVFCLSRDPAEAFLSDMVVDKDFDFGRKDYVENPGKYFTPDLRPIHHNPHAHHVRKNPLPRRRKKQ